LCHLFIIYTYSRFVTGIRFLRISELDRIAKVGKRDGFPRANIVRDSKCGKAYN